jgi:hypothetical protein
MAKSNQYHPIVWQLYNDLVAARKAVPYATATARIIDGIEKWVHYSGRHQPGDVSNPWFAHVLAMVWFARAAIVEQPGPEPQKAAVFLEKWSNMAETAWAPFTARAAGKKVEPWKPTSGQ